MWPSPRRCYVRVPELLEPRRLFSGAWCHAAPPPFARAPNSGPAVPLSAIAKAVGDSSPYGITPGQMRRFYGIDQISAVQGPADGRGQTIALIDAFDDPTAWTDLQTFDRTFGLPDPPSFTKINEYGGTQVPPADPNASHSTSNWEMEESMDIQWAHAVAPAAGLLLVEAHSADLIALATGAATAARWPGVIAVSLSFGFPEQSSEARYDPSFITPTGHGGVTFLASTGDQGAPVDTSTDGAPGYPAYSPNVIAVGGTSITPAANGSYTQESGWSGSGGGVSNTESEPAFQQSVQQTGHRSIPDVAMDADPDTGVAVCDSFDYGSATPWAQIGGTSLSSPMWGGLIALADQLRADAGLASLDGPTQTLPRLYSLPSSDFHDITAGSNGQYAAGPGYDEVTGLGTPVADKLVPDLAGVDLTRGSITGSIFSDLNDNGLRDPGEPGSPDLTVFLDLNHDGRLDGTDPTAITDSNGVYTFNSLAAGTYTVRQVVPPGYAASAPLGYAGVVSVAPGQKVVGPVFGDTPVASVPLDFNYLVKLAAHYDQPGTFADGDVNGDGAVNFQDLVLLAANYGNPLPSAAGLDQTPVGGETGGAAVVVNENATIVQFHGARPSTRGGATRRTSRAGSRRYFPSSISKRELDASTT